jgi:hypothetical protein
VKRLVDKEFLSSTSGSPHDRTPPPYNTSDDDDIVTTTSSFDELALLEESYSYGHSSLINLEVYLIIFIIYQKRV